MIRRSTTAGLILAGSMISEAEASESSIEVPVRVIAEANGAPVPSEVVMKYAEGSHTKPTDGQGLAVFHVKKCDHSVGFYVIPRTIYVTPNYDAVSCSLPETVVVVQNSQFPTYSLAFGQIGSGGINHPEIEKKTESFFASLDAREYGEAAVIAQDISNQLLYAGETELASSYTAASIDTGWREIILRNPELISLTTGPVVVQDPATGAYTMSSGAQKTLRAYQESIGIPASGAWDSNTLMSISQPENGAWEMFPGGSTRRNAFDSENVIEFDWQTGTNPWSMDQDATNATPFEAQ